MNVIKEINDKLKSKTIRINDVHGKVFIDIKPEYLLDFATFLFRDMNLRFIIASGIDVRNHIEILYHFTDDTSGKIYSLRVYISDKTNPQIDSLSPLMKGAEWIEREIHELLGVNFIGHPNLKHLLLNDDWPKGNYPLRHDNE